MELVFIVRDQEVGGSNPLAPTTHRISYLHHGKNLKSAWSMGKKVSGSNPLAPTVPFNHLRALFCCKLGPFGSNIGLKSPPSAATRSQNSGRMCVQRDVVRKREFTNRGEWC
jgi:hypothetical protein